MSRNSVPHTRRRYIDATGRERHNAIHIAECHIEYHRDMTEGDGEFVEVRRWKTADGEAIELVCEFGYVENGELETACTVLPFHWSLSQVLTWLGAKRNLVC